MVRIRVLRLSSIMYLLVVILLLAAIMFLSYRLITKDPVTIAPLLRSSITQQDDSFTVNPVYVNMLSSGFPAIARQAGVGKQSIFSSLWGIVSRKDMRDPRSIMEYQMPYLKNDPPTPEDAVAVSNNIPPPNRGDWLDRTANNPNLIIEDSLNENTYSEVSDDIKILIDQIEVDEKPIELSGEGPQVLIYQSHSREAYMQDPTNPYKEAYAEAFRSNDLEHTVIKIGEILAKNLNARGISVLHDATEHEQNDYNSSYKKSLETIMKRMAEYPSIQMFIDIHRNSYDEGTKINPDDEVIIINGQRVAKVFVVIGTGQGILGGFSQKPKWEENTKLAIKLTNKLNELYPGLAKNVLHKNGRYNQHISKNAILIEVGSTYTTQKEAERAAKYLAEALGKIIE